MRTVGVVILLALRLATDAGAQQSARREDAGRADGASAQRAAGINVTLPPSLTTPPPGPIVRTANVIADEELKRLVLNGFPAQLSYRADLWSRSGWFDDVVATFEWNVVIRYEPLAKTYRVARYVGNRAENLGRFERFEDAQATVARAYQPPLPARRSRSRQYYVVVLQVEVLSMSDLDEVDRWLRGEAKPAVRGKRNPGTALGRGLSTLATRLLGGESRRYEQRTETFRIEAANRD